MNITPQVFDPFAARLALQESRLESGKELQSLIAALANVKKSENLDSNLKQLFVKQLDFQVVPSDSEVEGIREALRSIRPQLQLISASLFEKVSQLDTDIARAKTLLLNGHYNPALNTSLMAGYQLDRVLAPIAELSRQLLKERVRKDQSLCFSLAEMFTCCIFDEVSARRGIDEQKRPLAAMMSPLFTSEEAYGSKATAEAVAAGIPFSITPLQRDMRENPWLVIGVANCVGRSLLRETGLLNEIGATYTSTIYGLTPTSQQLLRSWQFEVLSEIIACSIAGPAYVGLSIERGSRSAADVRAYTANPSGLPTILRWKLLLAVSKKLGFFAEAEAYEQVIARFYGPVAYVASYPVSDPIIFELLARADHIVEKLLEQGVYSLGGQRLLDSLPVYDSRIHQQALKITGDLLQGAGAKQADKGESNGKPAAPKRGVSQNGREQIQALLAATRIAFEQLSTQDQAVAQLKTLCEQYIPKNLSVVPTTSVEVSDADLQMLIRRSSGIRSGASFG